MHPVDVKLGKHSGNLHNLLLIYELQVVLQERQNSSNMNESIIFAANI